MLGGMDIRLGNVPEWVGGLGTIMAIGLAARTYSQDRKRDRAVQTRSQARLVDTWLDDSPGPCWETYAYPDADGRLLAVVKGFVTLSNASQEAVREFEIRVMWRGFLIATANLAILPPGRRSVRFESVEGHELPEAMSPGLDLEELRTFVEFTDSAGQRWTRTDKGRLLEIPDRPPTQREIQRAFRRGKIRQSTPYSRWRYYWPYGWYTPRSIWQGLTHRRAAPPSDRGGSSASE